ncbi:hypothetical protein Caci_3732 [Catenulispora acidiphila DSM 44928]|uniref:Uncharacterized protein n=1 Tax=Catenulispora acidiphila (strain DSM 44928 / JCM 14897 / NBRC 102108 / NRRL B-24433 / ID139908) TaxID=479433 RepID=C7QC15_CATAD|nr:hypothetical protein [Catenulispora acidiphila]ACU72634.1 hypothetical protein Caci_3732 [Catenulispora acidiphila DSM 44928]
MEVWDHENLLGGDDPIGDIRLGEVSAVWLRASLLAGDADGLAPSSLLDSGTATISPLTLAIGPSGG